MIAVLPDRAKLDEETVLAIRRGRACGRTYRELGEMHGTTESNAGAICRRVSWVHL